MMSKISLKFAATLLSAALVMIACKDEDDTPLAQVSPSFTFTQNWDGVPIENADYENTTYINERGESLTISKLVYLISDITFTDAQGNSFSAGDYNLIDAREGVNLSFTPDVVIEEGTYNVSFTFGFDDEDNAGDYPDLNSADGGVWIVPMMLGGGYHYMKLEGKYLDTQSVPEEEVGFAYHAIRANDNSTSPITLQDTSFTVDLGDVVIGEGTDIEVQMNVAEWFKNPHTWNLYELYSMLMPNFNAQILMSENGAGGVFSRGN
jgi:hypothetical protein